MEIDNQKIEEVIIAIKNQLLGNWEMTNEHLHLCSDLLKKLQKGFLLEIPCKVGDTIWFIREAIYKVPRNPCIEETKVDKIVVTKTGLKVKLSANSYETSVRNLQKTWFLTKQQAEARLKE